MAGEPRRRRPVQQLHERDDHSALAGRFLFEIIPGTVERGNPFDSLPTDVEYGRWLRDRSGNGAAFPAVLDAATGDPLPTVLMRG